MSTREASILMIEPMTIKPCLILESVTEVREFVRRSKTSNLKIGFVPTMGALHKGHVQLLRTAREQNDRVILSIFVNPTQFNEKSDFENYPKALTQDLEIAKNWGVDAVFLPNFVELYPDKYEFKVTEENLSKILCGQSRPGHFDGVLTVVLKLINIVQADQAYFGEKDFQQLELVTRMVKALFVPTKIVSVPTVRDSDGLALSSRNKRLSKMARHLAPRFPEILSKKNLSTEEKMKELANLDFKVDYIEVVQGRIYGAVWLEGVRLIDNFEVNP